MRIRFYVDSNANIHSCNNTDWFDTVKDLGLKEGEWEDMTEEKRFELANELVNEQGMLEIGWEVED